MKAERRISNRKEVYPLKISSMAVSESMAKIVRHGVIVNASSQGMLMHIRREDLIPRSLKNTLSLDSLIGDTVVIRIEEMNLELSGKITRTRLLGKEGFELAMDYTSDAPEYWRECLIDLLPTPQEFGELQKGLSNVFPLKSYKGNR
jgi:hypothetical protein